MKHCLAFSLLEVLISIVIITIFSVTTFDIIRQIRKDQQQQQQSPMCIRLSLMWRFARTQQIPWAMGASGTFPDSVHGWRLTQTPVQGRPDNQPNIWNRLEIFNIVDDYHIILTIFCRVPEEGDND